MDLNSRMNFDLKKVVIGLLIILLCLGIGVGIYLYTRTIKEPDTPVLPDRELVVDSTPIQSEIEEIEQEDMVGRFIATITNIRDMGTRIEYDIEVGLGENRSTSIVKATSKTVFYNFELKKIVNPADIKVYDTIVIYATGKHNVGNLVADVIALGDDTSYNYGKLSAVNTQESGSYIWTLDGGIDKLVIDADCSVINGYTGEPLLNRGIMQLEDKVLYKGVMTPTDLGNMYACQEVITFGK